jgi:hypothetical protein
MRISGKLFGAMALAAAIAMTGCSEVVGPAASPAVPTFDALMFQLTTPAEVAGEVTLCKDGPAGFTYTFTISQTAGVVNGITGTLGSLPEGGVVTLEAGECKLVWKKTTAFGVSGITGDIAVDLSITEQGPPAGTLFDDIVFVGAWSALNPDIDLENQTVSATPNRFHGAVVTFVNVADQATEPGAAGCTPGYWKNTRLAWPIPKNTNFDAFFGVTLHDVTLETAVGMGGGGVRAFGRHATAAALNAAMGAVDYPLSSAQVAAAVQAVANGTMSMAAAHQLFEGYNELGCPIPNR